MKIVKTKNELLEVFELLLPIYEKHVDSDYNTLNVNNLHLGLCNSAISIGFNIYDIIKTTYVYRYTIYQMPHDAYCNEYITLEKTAQIKDAMQFRIEWLKVKIEELKK